MNAAERLHLARKADFCVRWLKAQGLQVIAVNGDESQPRITVRYCELCERFDDIVHAYVRSKRKGEIYLAWVFRHDCLVVWDDITGIARSQIQQERAYLGSMGLLRRLQYRYLARGAR